jgi:hypothetical protein
VNIEKNTNSPELLRGYTLIFGQNVKLPDKCKGKLVSIGLCTRKFRGKGGYIPGCPPHPQDILDFFEKMGKSSKQNQLPFR